MTLFTVGGRIMRRRAWWRTVAWVAIACGAAGFAVDLSVYFWGHSYLLLRDVTFLTLLAVFCPFAVGGVALWVERR
jgi:uncharacterized membrane protein YhaH (DUF805 family)